MNNFTRALKTLGGMLLVTGLMDAHANNISFTEELYSGTTGSEISVTLTYDFTSYSMFRRRL